MIPGLVQWKTWSALERASYIAQIATAGAFFASSLFAYLSWREAAGARDEQRKFFVAEKTPLFEITIDNTVLFSKEENNTVIGEFKLKNKGASTAENINFLIDFETLNYIDVVQRGVRIRCTTDRVEKDHETDCAILYPLRGSDDFYRKIENGVAVLRDLKFDLKSKNDGYSTIKSLVTQMEYSGILSDKHRIRQVFWLMVAADRN